MVGPSQKQPSHDPEAPSQLSCFHRKWKWGTTYRGGRRLSSYQWRVFAAGVLEVGVLSPVELNTHTHDEQANISLNGTVFFLACQVLMIQSSNHGDASTLPQFIQQWARCGEFWVSQLESSSCFGLTTAWLCVGGLQLLCGDIKLAPDYMSAPISSNPPPQAGLWK